MKTLNLSIQIVFRGYAQILLQNRISTGIFFSWQYSSLLMRFTSQKYSITLLLVQYYRQPSHGFWGIPGLKFSVDCGDIMLSSIA